MNKIVYVGKHLLTLSVARHAHGTWEFVYCTSGCGEFLFDDFTLHYKEGEIVVIPPYVPHSNWSRDGFTNLHVNMADINLPFKIPTVIPDDSNHFILDTINAAYFHFSGDKDARRLLLPVYGDLLFGYMMAYQTANPLSKVVEEIESTIIKNYQDCNFELDKYLQSLPFSYDYLRKLFKKELGVTPHKYLSDKRLQTAADMLNCGFSDSYNIAEISQLCGFREPLYFSRIFKSKYGVAPSHYLEEQKSISPEDLDSDSMKIKLDSKNV